jgi:drug/metabolite transporter (DMT)-like permease
MTQQQAIQLFLPILILLPVLYFRMRHMTKAQPLKLTRMWIRPAIFLALATLVLVAPGQHGEQHNWTHQAFAWLALAAAIGGAAGWYWGRTMAIEVHPEDGTLMVKGGQAALLVLVILILFRLGLRTGLEMEGRAWHLDIMLISDASIVFTAALFVVRNVEMYIRARRVMAVSGS